MLCRITVSLYPSPHVQTRIQNQIPADEFSCDSLKGQWKKCLTLDNSTH